MLNSSKTAGGKATTPSSYDLRKVKLTMNDGSVTDIKGLISTVVINESLFKQSIQVDIEVVDGVDLFQKSHISGGEKIEIKLGRIENTNLTGDKSEKAFNIEVYIAEISDHVKPKEGIQYYRLTCLSLHAFIDQFKSLSRSFSGNINALIRDICKQDLNVTSVDFSNKNLPSIKGIYPNTKPLDAITWLLRNSADEDTPFFFYETINDGLQLNSYRELLDKELYKTYNNTTYFESAPETPEYFVEASKKIINMSSDFNMSQYHQIKDGSYASTIHCVDISNKKYEQTVYSRTDDNLLKLNDFNSLSNKIKFNDLQLNKNYTAKEYFISTNSNSFNALQDEVNYHSISKDNLSKKNSYFQNLKFMGLDIDVYGDFDISPGRIVELKIPKSTDANILKSEGLDGMKDKLLSGKYLVSSISHIFDGDQYTCDIGLQKDSLLYDLDSKITIGN